MLRITAKDFDLLLKVRETLIQVNEGLPADPETVEQFILYTKELEERKEKDLEEIHLSDLQALLEKQVGRRVDLPYEIEAKRVYEGLRLYKKDLDTREMFCVEVDFTDGVFKEYQWGTKHITCQLIKNFFLFFTQGRELVIYLCRCDKLVYQHRQKYIVRLVRASPASVLYCFCFIRVNQRNPRSLTFNP